MKIIKIIPLLIFCNISVANECTQELGDKALFKNIHRGLAIAYPFKKSHIIDGKNEPELKTVILDYAQENNIIKSSRHLYTASIKRGAEEVFDYNQGTVLFRGPDSGWHVTWYFIKKNNCWLLTGLENQST